MGFVSVLGYTPDVFFAPVTGRILDASPGAAGHQDYFAFLSGVAVVGLAVTAVLYALHRRGVLWGEDEIKAAGSRSGSAGGDA